jgi:Asp-tRNA(Asn)/Glu-tRNA(Gln) amidotransferase A subunit family amidase
MNAEDAIAAAKRKKRMAVLLEKGTERNLAEANELIDMLARSLAVQGASIIDVREKMVDHKDAIERVASIARGDEDGEPVLLDFKPPQLIGIK